MIMIEKAPWMLSIQGVLSLLPQIYSRFSMA
jgi:hypothetical protein